MLLLGNQLFLGDLSFVAHNAQRIHQFGGHVAGTVGLRAAGDVDGREVHSRHGHQVAGHGLIGSGDADHGVVRVGQSVNLRHIADDVPRRETEAHAGMGLGYAVADIGAVEFSRLAAACVNAELGLLDKIAEMHAGRVGAAGPHSPQAPAACPDRLLSQSMPMRRASPLAVDVSQSLTPQRHSPNLPQSQVGLSAAVLLSIVQNSRFGASWNEVGGEGIVIVKANPSNTCSILGQSVAGRLGALYSVIAEGTS